MSDDIFKGLKLSKVNFEMPKIETPHFNTGAVDRAMKAIHQVNADKIAREKKTVELLEKLLEKTQTGSVVITDSELVNIVNGDIDTLQQVTGGSTGYQINNKQQGVHVAEVLSALEAMKQVFEFLPADEKQEAAELADAMESQLKSEEPKKGVAKRLAGGLLDLGKKAIQHPIATIKGADFLTQHGSELVQHFEHAFDRFLDMIP